MTRSKRAAAVAQELAEVTTSPHAFALAAALHAFAYRHHLVPSLLHLIGGGR